MAFSDIITTLLKEKKLKQSELCRMTDIPTSLMSEYVSGKKSPAILNAISIADALNVSLDQLVGRDNTENVISSSPYEKEFTEIFVNLTPETQQYLLLMAKELLYTQQKLLNKKEST